MAVDAAVDQALALKKRARRRLVGAIALVLLMLIILPNVLKDRAQEEQRAPITLTMPEVPAAAIDEQKLDNPAADQLTAPQPPAEPAAAQSVQAENDSTSTALALTDAPVKDTPKLEHARENLAPKVDASNAQSQSTTKPIDAKAPRFLIQVGVFSDPENVKKLQSKISDAGFSSRTVKLVTTKGEKIRLRVGSFVTRDAAAEALKKLEAHGISGMVLTDE